MSHNYSKSAILIVLCLLSAAATAAQPFRYPEGKHGKGELRYIDGLPVLTVGGSREEMGEQVGVLALKPAASLVKHFQDYLEQKGLGKISPVIFAASEAMFSRFPKEYRDEIEAMIKAAGADRNLIVLGNTAFDLQQLLGCSGLLVSAERSATGGSLYGRNFDFPFDDPIAEYSLVIVYRPDGQESLRHGHVSRFAGGECRHERRRFGDGGEHRQKKRRRRSALRSRGYALFSGGARSDGELPLGR